MVAAGALVGALVGAALFGFAVNGFVIPGRHATHITTALEAIPGALIGIALIYFEGARRERAGEAGGITLWARCRLRQEGLDGQQPPAANAPVRW